MNFQFTVRTDGVRPHQTMALHWMVALAWMGAGAMAHRLHSEAPWGLGLGILGLILLSLGWTKSRWMQRPKVNGPLRLVEAGIMAGFSFYAARQGWWPALITLGGLTLAVLYAYTQEKHRQRSRMILISEAGVQIPGKWKSLHRGWDEMENLLYRQGIVTINDREGRFLQFRVHPPAEDWKPMEERVREWIHQHRSPGNKG